MGKYDPLARFLEGLDGDSWDAKFSDVESVLGFRLPHSAHEYPAWWANQEGGHSQTRGWREAGWETRKVDLAAKRLQFVRRRREAIKRAVNSSPSATATLWEQAAQISGIEDRERLIEVALAALIQREAARTLIRLGGSDPQATAAPRERPWK
jgi:hypothetical protein